MLRQAGFFLIALFWVTMNVLLWRAEYGQRSSGGSLVSQELVWNRILTAPDDSALALMREERKIGYVRWTPSIREPAFEEGEEGSPLEGMVREALGYSVRLEGHILLENLGRVRFNLQSAFDRELRWNGFDLRGTVHGATYWLEAAAEEGSLKLGVQDGAFEWERAFSFRELQDPTVLLGEFGFPLPLGMLAPGLSRSSAGSLSLGLDWEARSDWIRIARTPVRIYRLEARVLDRYSLILYISRAGEILRAELPQGLVLVNEALFP